MALAQHNTHPLTVGQSEEFTSAVTATSTSVTIHRLTIAVTTTKRHPLVTVPVTILADIMPRKLLLHIISIATTPALTAAIMQPTGSATHAQGTIHKQCATPFQKVTSTAAETGVTIIALRCPGCANVSLPTILHLPEKPVPLSAAYTPIKPVTMSHHIVPCITQTTVSATPIVLPI